MEIAVLGKRIWLYIFNLFIYMGIGFSSSLPFLLVLHLHWALYILISIGITIVISILFSFFLLLVTRGYTIGSAIFGVKYIGARNEKIKAKQAFVRAFAEAILLFAVFDLFYFWKNRTERGVIDRLTGTFAIDIRR